MPRIGVSTVKGVNMEKEGVVPDYVVDAHPDQLARGVDAQLDKAVEVLRQEVAQWRKTRGPVALNPPGPGLPPGGTLNVAPAPAPEPAPAPRKE